MDVTTLRGKQFGAPTRGPGGAIFALALGLVFLAPPAFAHPEFQAELARLEWVRVPLLDAAMNFLLLGVLILLLSCLVRLRVRRERQLQDKASDSYRLIAQASNSVAFELDLEHRLIRWTSDLGVDLLGLEPGCFSEHPESLEERVHEDERESAGSIWATLSRGERVHIEFRLLGKGGAYRWIHLDATPLHPGQGRVTRAVGMLRDTQDLHEAQEALAESKRAETMGTMAGGIAHEFNNHLTPIRGFIELALDDIGANHPAADGLNTALERVQHCTDLVSQVQAYGQKSLIRPEVTEVSSTLPRIVRFALSLNPERADHITIHEEIHADAQPIWVDQTQFQQGVLQLVRNAMEAMPDGGTLTVRTEETLINKQPGPLGQVQAGTYLCLSIIDTGEGIAPEHREHIFDPFFTTRGRAMARGMGLPMVQGMVAQHRGWIELQSEQGKGTTVKLFLPVASRQAGEVKPGIRDDAMEVLPVAPEGSCMLVIDDEEDVRTLIKRVFEKEAWEVKQAANGDEALAVFKANREQVDLVLLDLTMPGPPTEEIIERIRSSRPNLSIILMSGFDENPRIERLKKEHHVQFISKPFSPKAVLSKVDEVVSAAA